MLLTLLDDLPTSRRYAIDENGTVWMQFDGGLWARGCLADAGDRHVFLQPLWALSWAPLTLAVFRSRFFNEREAAA